MARPVKVLVLADTHVRPGPEGRLPAGVYAAAAEADVILHAGDILTAAMLDELEGFAPVHAVLGNNDEPALADRLPETLQIELGDVRLAMIHDSGATSGRERRLARRFPLAEVVVFGHSHAPVNEVGVDGQVLFNPGSATTRRRQPVCTYGTLRLAGGRVVERSIVDLPRGADVVRIRG